MQTPAWMTFAPGLVLLVAVLVIWFYRRAARVRKRDLDAKASPVLQRPAPVSSRADIFLSYASADRAFAETLANALKREGWTVWWDRTILAGKSFDEVIEAALDAAACVIVVWSKTSVASDWVKAEASDAARRRILIPVLIEDVTIPLEFRRLQAADLEAWRASSSHHGYDLLVASVASLVRPPHDLGSR